MYKAKVNAIGIELEFEEKDIKDLWKRVSFFQSLPVSCPIDDSPTRLYYKEPDGYSYFSICNTGDLYFEYKLGQAREGGELFPKGEWWWWDWEKKEDVLLCKYNVLTPEGEAMRERCLQGNPRKLVMVDNKTGEILMTAQNSTGRAQPQQSSNRTIIAQNTAHAGAQPVKNELDAINVHDAPPLDDSWDGIVAEVEANRVQDKKAKATAGPFVWPVNDDALEMCSGFINLPDLTPQQAKLINAITEADKASKNKMSNEVKEGKKSSQYGTLAWRLDDRYGKGSHGAILSALCQRSISSDNLPGYEVKKLLDWLFKPEDFGPQLGVLDGFVEALKQDLQQLEGA